MAGEKINEEDFGQVMQGMGHRFWVKVAESAALAAFSIVLLYYTGHLDSVAAWAIGNPPD